MKKLVAFVHTGWVAVFLLSTFSLRAVPGDEHWDPQFGVPGVTNNIFAIAVNGGLLYAAGSYSAVSTTNAVLYLWDGLQWSVPAVFGGPAFLQVSDLAFVGNTLYAAGTFTNVNGVAANGLAKWDGMSWSSIGFSGTASALAVDGNNLYVGGSYTNAGGVATTNIGYWDGSAWHALGNGLSPVGPNNVVQAIVVHNGLVYVGGIFTNSGTSAVANLAVWDGSIWTQVGGGISSTGSVRALVFNGNDLYVGGYFQQAGNTPVSSIARWDGANWSNLGGGLTGNPNAVVSGIAVLNGAICVVGGFTGAGGIVATNFAIWNGSSWSTTGNGLSAVGLRVVSTGTNVYVGGSFGAAGGVLVNFIGSWNGTRWSGLGTPGRLNGVQGFVFALANDGTNLYAGGIFNYVGQTNANYIARFDGTNWYPLGSGVGPVGLSTSVNAIAVSNNNVFVGGSFSQAGTALALGAARWDGTNWYGFGLGPGSEVASLVVRTDGVYAAGAALNGNPYGFPFFSRWDGTNWNGVLHFPLGSLFDMYNSDSVVGMAAIAVQGTNLFLGGHFLFEQCDTNLNNCTNCNNILRFDGTYAWIMGTGLNSNVVAMTVLGTNLYAAGLFTNAGGIMANKLAMWNGNAWTNVGGSVVGSGSVFALTTMGNNLYAGGSFTNMGGVSVGRIAKWDGTNWSALGGGIGGRSAGVQSLGAFGSDVYVGGNFKFAGDKNASSIARWNEQINFDTPQLTGPTFASGQFHIRLAGIGGLTNIIQATTNFVAWTPVLTNSAGIYDFTDPNSSSYPFRFYRAVLGP
jgi:hypothetical protein